MSSSAGTSFYQFQYCDLCKLSHKQREKKHVYSKRHQLTLKNTLLKLTEKVKIAKLNLGCPDIQSFGWEAGARVWCYFCQCEVPKHQARQDCTIANASFIHHLAHVDHAKRMHAFFWENWIPAGQKVDFFISREDAVRFYENAEKAVERYLKKEKHKMMEERDKICTADQLRQAVKWTGIQQELVRSSSVGRDEPVSLSSVSVPKDSRTAGSVGKKTLSAFGHGLTYISVSSLVPGEKVPHNSHLLYYTCHMHKERLLPFGYLFHLTSSPEVRTRFARGAPRKSAKRVLTSAQQQESRDPKEEGGEESKGNIYTGATPPWLIEDGPKSNGEIGPTAATFSQYLKNLQKQKLPACRVGAAFNRTVNTTTQWLPAFGRVWSNGRRLGSKNQFYRERKRTKARGMRTPDTPVIPSTSLHSSSLGSQEQVTQLQASSTITSNNVRSSGASFYPRSSVSGSEGVYANTQHSTEPPLPVACSIKSCSTTCASSKTLPSATPGQLHQPHTSATITITTRGSRDSKVSADSRPYKRQRPVQKALAPQATSLIPVTSKLLSVPSKRSKSS